MAADTRDTRSSKQAAGILDTTAPTTKTYDTFNYPATPENKDSLPGANPNALAAKRTEPGIVDALKTIKLQDFKEVHKKPCTREGFLTGIGAAFATGGVRAILGAPIFTACSWAVGAFVFGSFAMHEYCQKKRRQEKEGIQRVHAALLGKKIEEEKKREELRKARRQAKAQADR
ncbi:MAG: hypothetical protein Q9166_007045 [cf. Caloplaca sp. 2 TL-2023]